MIASSLFSKFFLSKSFRTFNSSLSIMHRIGSISYDSEHIIGNGHNATTIYRGRFEKTRDVAIKKVSKQYVDLVDRERMALVGGDSHENVIRYFCTEEDKEFYYLALEFCKSSLEEYVNSRKSLTSAAHLPAKDVLYQVAKGLNHLHSKNISWF